MHFKPSSPKHVKITKKIYFCMFLNLQNTDLKKPEKIY